MLGEVSYKHFVECARQLPGFVVGQKEDVPYDITELANNYCRAYDANDKQKMSQYISALMVRYWHMVVMTYNTSLSTRLEFDDIVSWMYEAFEKAFKYRSWLDPEKAVSKDPKGAEKCINQCITSVRQYWYANFNKDKRKINYLTFSLDDPNLVNKSETTGTLMDIEPDVSANESTLDEHELINAVIRHGSLFQAIILDGIIFQDSFNEYSTTEKLGVDEEGNEIEHTSNYSEFSLDKLFRHLKKLDNDFVEYFSNTYDVDKEVLMTEVSILNKLKRAVLKDTLVLALSELKSSSDLRKYLCK